MWIILSILAGLLLIIYFKGPNAVWGGLSFGIVAGIVAAIISAISNNGFDFSLIGKIIIVGTLVGFLFELLGKLSNKIKSKN